MSSGRPLLYTLVVAVVVSTLVFAGMTQKSFAHPITLNSSPRPFQSLPSSPSEVTLSFSEPIELSYSKISVLAPDGSRVDKNDPHLVNGDTASLGVSLKPNLSNGVYTVSTKVLSAVDGHVVESAFTFGIGTAATLPIGGAQAGAPSQILSPAESASRFPGMVGQVIVVGAAFGSLWLWKPLSRVPWLSSAVSAQRAIIDRKMVILIIIGAALVIGSNLAMIAVQAIDINAGIPEAIATKFGNVWTTRMIESSILMIIALFVYRKLKKTETLPSKAEILAILVMGFAVLVTSSLIAHGAATGQISAILLDFFHNTAASIWIGGLILMGFVAVPQILAMVDERARAAAISILIPRFSTIVVTILGIAIITGPLLLFLIESDLSLTIASTYGKVLIIKLALAGVMVAMGGYSQFVIQKKAVAVMVGGSTVHANGYGRFAKSLKVEAGVGIALLLMVSIMANSALPAGEFPQYGKQQTADQQAAFASTASASPQQSAAASTKFTQMLYTSTGNVKLTIDPFALGQNRFTLAFSGSDNKPLDVSAATVKLTQVEKGIGPINVNATRQPDGTFAADAAFSLAGTWTVQVEGVRSSASNIVANLDVPVRPAISSLSFDVKEFKTPEKSLPLFPVFDSARQSIWVGDQSLGSGRIWQFNIATGSYTAHKLNGINLVSIIRLAPDGKIWYIDPTTYIVGRYDPNANTNTNFNLPEKGIISGLAIDNNGNIWMPLTESNKVYKFEPGNGKFTAYNIPTPESGPVNITVDRDGKLWMPESSAGKIAMIDPATGKITEFAPKGQNKLVIPTAIFPDPTGHDLFISEHEGHRVTGFNPLFEIFHQYPLLNNAGLPFGMAADSYGNIWVAEHTVDRVAVFDPRTGQSTEAKIPTAGSFVQYLVADDKGKIWFAEQQGSALGSITTTAAPSAPTPPPTNNGTPAQTKSPVTNVGFSLADLAGPAIAAGIVISAMMYAKSAVDLKRNVRAAAANGRG
jgi:copper transport protein